MGKGKGGGGSKGGGTQVVISEPPAYLKRSLSKARNSATDIYEGDPLQYYDGSTVVDFSNESEQGLQAITDRALNGSPLIDAATGNVMDNINGDYLNQNPYIDDVVKNSMDDVTRNYLNNVLPNINSTFSGSGRFGSGLQGRTIDNANANLADSLGQTASSIRYNNYNDERQRQQQALAFAPTFANQAYQDGQQLVGVGQARESLDQARLQEDIDRFNFDQNQQGIQLDEYINRLTNLAGAGGGSQTNIGGGAAAPNSGGILGGLSGAAGAHGLATTLGAASTGPVGIGAAVLGGLGGLFG